MNLALTLLASAGTLGWMWPRFFARIRHRLHPHTALTLWPVTQSLFVLLVVAAAIALALPARTAEHLASLLGSCWELLAHGSPQASETIAGASAGLLVGAVLVRIFYLARGERVRQKTLRDKYVGALHLAGTQKPEHPGVWWLDTDTPVAFCVAGKNPTVGASTGLFNHLTADEVGAVLAHERAHARFRHHTLILWAESVGRTLPCVPLFAHSPSMVRELAEQAADAEAALDHGHLVVASALRTMSAIPAPAPAPSQILEMVSGTVTTRLERLCAEAYRHPRRRHSVQVGTLLGCAMAVPLVGGCVAALAMYAFSCT